MLIRENVCPSQYCSPTYVAIIRILKWMSSASDDNGIFLTYEIPRLDHCSCPNWTSDSHKGMPSLDVRNYSNTVYLLPESNIRQMSNYNNANKRRC